MCTTNLKCAPVYGKYIFYLKFEIYLDEKAFSYTQSLRNNVDIDGQI